MRKIFFASFVAVFVASCSNGENSSEPIEKTETVVSKDSTTKVVESAPKKLASPRMQASGFVDQVEINVDYGSPSVKGRPVWGHLEKYGEVWRAGANECTTVEFSDDVLLNDEVLTAGKYAFFIIPEEEKDWTVIFNTDTTSWGSYDYNESKDALRLSVTPEQLEEVTESLEYSVIEQFFNFSWDKIKLSIEIKKG